MTEIDAVELLEQVRFAALPATFRCPIRVGIGSCR